MNDTIKEKLKLKIAISQIKNEEEERMHKKEKIVAKNIGIAACTIISLVGVAFASEKVIENIWKTPEKVQNVTYEITEESKKENITEEQAKEIAINKLHAINFNANIVGTNHYKEVDSDKIIYRFQTEDAYEISIDGETGKFFKVANNNQNIQDRNLFITEEEGKEIANQYYQQFGFEEGAYEIVDVWSNSIDGSGKGPGYSMFFTYNKKYGDTYNPYESISIGVESKNKSLDYLVVEDIPFDNNETRITKEEALQIALEEDKKIDTNQVIETKVEKRVVKMNANAYDRIYNTQKFYDAMQTVDYPIDERSYYNVEDKVRNAWVVVLTYEDNFEEDIVKRYTEGQYSYFVDCTTGEIIGGAIMDYTYSHK